MPGPDIFDYDDYRRFLSDWFDWKGEDRRAQGKPSYSHRMFTAEAGVPSSAALLRVITGARDLTEGMARAFLIPLNLGPAEQDFFLLLVACEAARVELAREEARAVDLRGAPAPDKTARRRLDVQNRSASDAAERLRAVQDQLVASRRMHRATLMTQQHELLLSSWYSVTIREMTQCAGFRPDPEWIASKLVGEISPAVVAETIERLVEAGLLVREPDGRLVGASEAQVTADLVKNTMVWRYYNGMLGQLSDAVRRAQSDNSFHLRSRLGSLTIAVPSAELPRIRETFLAFRKQLFAFFEGLSGERDAVYQVWLHLFPLTEVMGEPDGAGER